MSFRQDYAAGLAAGLSGEMVGEAATHRARRRPQPISTVEEIACHAVFVRGQPAGVRIGAVSIVRGGEPQTP